MKELNIRHFKLLNGEEIIGLVAVKNDDSWIVERPLTISSNILGGFQFQPWFPFSEHKTYKVMKEHIINHVMVAEDVKKAYVDFALSLQTKRVPLKAPRSNMDIMEEMEAALQDRYEEERMYPEVDLKKETIH